MMKPVANATNTTTTKLGRWQLHYDPKVVNSKVDQANEDHCGCYVTNYQPFFIQFIC